MCLNSEVHFAFKVALAKKVVTNLVQEQDCKLEEDGGWENHYVHYSKFHNLES